MVQADIPLPDSTEKFIDAPEHVDATVRIAIHHSTHVEIASRSFWNACHVDLERALQAMHERWRDPDEEFERVRNSVRKGMTAALEEVSRAYHSQGERTHEDPETGDRLNQSLSKEKE